MRLHKILIIDDNEIFLMGLKSSLRDICSDIICISSVEEAIKYIDSHDDIQLIITDYCFDGEKKTGQDLINHIRSFSFNEYNRHVPIICVTGYDEKKDIIDKAQIECTRTLIKPISKTTIIKLIKEMVCSSDIYVVKQCIKNIENNFKKERIC